MPTVSLHLTCLCPVDWPAITTTDPKTEASMAADSSELDEDFRQLQ